MTHPTTPELPTLNSGVTLLDVESKAIGALQSLVLDHILVQSGSAVWIDSDGNGTTHPIARLAPSMRILDRIRIARAFTPWQHYSLLEDIADELTVEVSLLVLPAFDALYRSDDLHSRERDRMLVDGIAHVADLAASHDLPVLVTRTQDDQVSTPIVDTADERLHCEVTPLGPRFSGREYDTLVYPVDEDWVQTTFAFWRRVLTDRHPAADHAGVASISPEVSASGPY